MFQSRASVFIAGTKRDTIKETRGTYGIETVKNVTRILKQHTPQKGQILSTARNVIKNLWHEKSIGFWHI